MPIPTLPIDAEMPRIVAALRARGSVVIVAEPGAGKTTRVPPALIELGKDVIVVQPRRVAARMAAARVASELGEDVGNTVGYQVRFDSRTGPRTRLRFVTEGVLQRLMVEDPELTGVGTVILDEFHERSLTGDLLLALLVRGRRLRADAPRLAIMSATLDPEPVARLIDGDVVEVEGRLHPVALEHAESRARRDLPLERRVTAAVSRALDEEREGDLLVFLPGTREIRRAQESCALAARAADAALLPLHGGLPLSEQVRAIQPGASRRIILATNVAETSLTVEGVRVVIDSGLKRQAVTVAGTGLSVLNVVPISRASAEQRAGRAGRVAPGRCIRLYTLADLQGRQAATPPEILDRELAEIMLTLAVSGVASPESLPWLDAPPAGAVAHARRLLERLGAIDASGAATRMGHRMARLPLPARRSRALVAATQAGVGRQAARVLALLEAADARQERGAPEVEDTVARALSSTGGLTRVQQRVHDQLLRSAGSDDGGSDRVASDETNLRRALLVGHPDRVGQRRRSGELVLAGGGAVTLAQGGHALEGDWFVVLDTRAAPSARGSLAVAATAAAAIESDWLLDLHSDWITEERRLEWNDSAARVEARERMMFGTLVLDERVDTRPSGEDVEVLLVERARAAGVVDQDPAGALARLLGRVAVAASVVEEFPTAGETLIERALAELCTGASSLAELSRRGGVESAIMAALERQRPGASALLDQLAPEQVALPCGRRLRVDYQAARPPSIHVFLQDLMGSRSGPVIAGGRVPLVLHILAPNRRPLQVTTDLEGFWKRHYPAIRRQLRQRYTRHAWPEDPASASGKSPPRKG